MHQPIGPKMGKQPTAIWRSGVIVVVPGDLYLLRTVIVVGSFRTGRNRAMSTSPDAGPPETQRALPS
jgi:hypothetical protein